MVYQTQKYSSLTSLVNITDYYPFGKELRFYKGEPNEKFLSTQHERDRASSYDHRQARNSTSEFGVFLSMDPLAFKMPSWTPYHYTFNNPISFTDPNRMEPQVYVDGIKMGGSMGRFYGNMALDGLNNAVDESRDITYEHYTTMSMGEYSETHFLGLSTNKNASFGALIDNPFYRQKRAQGEVDFWATAAQVGLMAGELSRQGKAYQFLGQVHRLLIKLFRLVNTFIMEMFIGKVIIEEYPTQRKTVLVLLSL